MNKITIGIRSIITLVLLLVCSLPSGAQELVSNNVHVGSLTYDFYDDGTAEVVYWKTYTSLKSVVVPEKVKDYKVTSIGHNAFDGCGLTNIELPSTLTSIGDSAFYFCFFIESVDIPSSVTSIGKSAFCMCRSLVNVKLPSSLTSIEDFCFSSCYSLTSINLPPTITNIGDGAFDGCGSLTSIDLPTSVTSIGAYAFEWCESLTSISLPASITSIDDGAFGYCSALKEIVCYAEVPPTTDELLSEYDGVTLYVPSSSIDAYKTSQYVWGKFSDIKPLDEYDAIDLPNASICDTPNIICTFDGVRVSGSVSSLKPGMYLIRQGGKVRKVQVK